MCKKDSLSVSVTTFTYRDDKLSLRAEKVFEKTACFRCYYNELIANYLGSSVPWQLVDTLIDDNVADLTFEVNYIEGKRSYKRRILITVQRTYFDCYE